MESFVINGGRALRGEVRTHGAKNSALPILAATLLGKESIIHNCPDLSDIEAAQNILKYLGCSTKREGNSLIVNCDVPMRCDIPQSLMREMRSSIVFLGAIIARCGSATLSYPGGCEIGIRPIDLHLSSLEKMGVTIKDNHGNFECTAESGLIGATISLPFPSVGATENIMIAASMAKGDTTIVNAAREPEIVDLADFLNACGGRVSMSADGTVNIRGVNKLHSAQHTVIPDRIVAATYLCAAAATKGEVLITEVRPAHLMPVTQVLEEMGCTLKYYANSVFIKNSIGLSAVKSIRTMPYPGFPTDIQAPVMVLAAIADGTTVFIENIFENRYMHVPELNRMGAKINVEGRVAVVEGVDELQSATVRATDLRGGGAMVIAGLVAKGKTEITNIAHIKRGYENFDITLQHLGASIVSKNN